MSEITQDRLKELCLYNPGTGELVWRERQNGDNWEASWNSRNAGKIVGSKTADGYLETSVDGEKFLVHRLVWLFIHGEHPYDFIDHINGVRDDNRIQNLRIAPQILNSKNQRMRSTNTSGYMGIAWSAQHNKWAAQIMASGRTTHLGKFDNIEDAVAARKAAEKALGFHPNHGRPA